VKKTKHTETKCKNKAIYIIWNNNNNSVQF
jgi:hypothetical protein